MRYVVVITSPLLLFAAVLGAGFWLASPDDLPRPPQPVRVEAVQQLAVELHALSAPPQGRASEEGPSPPTGITTEEAREPGVPHGLEAPLRAVANDVNLCVPHWLERDRGPIDVSIRFTPGRAGTFAPGVTVTSSWDDPLVEACIAEVFEEATFWPQADGVFRPSEFTFHFPDDAQRGLLGMRFVR
ncbi:MAG: hypothetical protein JNJ54_21260 [Myxococcaceae bacterium]|nr:hypothetical protein [Myxococcaceae bacterium]